MEVTAKTEQFVQRLTENQNRLFGYIFSLLGDRELAADVLQETNLVLWRKLDEFSSNQPFLPWAFAIARFQVLASIRDQKRDRVLLDSELAKVVADEVGRQAERFADMQNALRACMGSLTGSSRDMIEKRYLQGQSIADVSASIEKSESAVKVALFRARRALAECVQKRLSTDGAT